MTLLHTGLLQGFAIMRLRAGGYFPQTSWSRAAVPAGPLVAFVQGAQLLTVPDQAAKKEVVSLPRPVDAEPCRRATDTANRK
jgi:hypothetical protein